MDPSTHKSTPMEVNDTSSADESVEIKRSATTHTARKALHAMKIQLQDFIQGDNKENESPNTQEKVKEDFRHALNQLRDSNAAHLQSIKGTIDDKFRLLDTINQKERDSISKSLEDLKEDIFGVCHNTEKIREELHSIQKASPISATHSSDWHASSVGWFEGQRFIGAYTVILTQTKNDGHFILGFRIRPQNAQLVKREQCVQRLPAERLYREMIVEFCTQAEAWPNCIIKRAVTTPHTSTNGAYAEDMCACQPSTPNPALHSDPLFCRVQKLNHDTMLAVQYYTHHHGIDSINIIKFSQLDN